jgi:hypothetical protein
VAYVVVKKLLDKMALGVMSTQTQGVVDSLGLGSSIIVDVFWIHDLSKVGILVLDGVNQGLVLSLVVTSLLPPCPLLPVLCILSCGCFEAPSLIGTEIFQSQSSSFATGPTALLQDDNRR